MSCSEKFFRVFYPKPSNKREKIENLVNDIGNKNGKESGIFKFFNDNSNFLFFLRNLRNGLEHPNKNECTQIEDFMITPNGDIHFPSIELVHKKTPQPKVGIDLLLPHISKQLIDIAESSIAFACASNTTYPYVAGIMELPEERRQNKFARLSYSVLDSKGNPMPLG